MSDGTESVLRSEPAPARRRVVEIGLSDHDHMTWMTWVCALGLGTALVLALIGGLPVDLPMPTHRFGWVEPSCGLTRGSTAIVRGDFSTAWRYNPLSFLVVTFGLVGLARAAGAR